MTPSPTDSGFRASDSELLTPSLILEGSFQQRTNVIVPTSQMLELPEKVLQFGTGGFLRAFADYFIDVANREGLFGGRVVMVGSTGSKRTQMLNEQGGLYTLRIQGLERGHPIERYHIVGAVSRALSAKDQWGDVLALAKSPDLEIILSNTTEVGITYDPADRMGDGAPVSFPGKLTAVLFERGRHYDYDQNRGLVVLPCELITDNGKTLKSIVLRLADLWGLPSVFIDWVRECVHFCNTLVDRIVPGTPSPAVLDEIYSALGYRDTMLTTAEVYRLWPIEGEQVALDRLTFAEADPGIVLTDDVHPYKERKVRILNGAHTSSVPMAFLSGEDTVIDMMRNEVTLKFVRTLMREEIVPSLDVPGGEKFASDVLDRFGNPYLRHRLLDITLQSTSKWRFRLLPSIEGYYAKNHALPECICAGFAAYLLFMRGKRQEDGIVYGERDGISYPIRDDHAGYFMDAWAEVDDGEKASIDRFVEGICNHEPFWGDTLRSIPGFSDRVSEYCWEMLNSGVRRTIEKVVH